MKPVNLSQLLFHAPTRTLSFFYTCPKHLEIDQDFDDFFKKMIFEIDELKEFEILNLLTGQKSTLLKIIKRYPGKTFGFFFSNVLNGYVIVDTIVEPYYQIGANFHVRPLLEETLVNPEFILVNVSFYDIKIYRGDFQHLEILDHFEFDQFHQTLGNFSPRLYAPQYMGIIPYKTLLALKNLSRKIAEKYMYESVPVIVTGLSDTRHIFLQGFEHAFGVISHLDEDFYEKTCMEILAKCKSFRHIVADYYSAQLKERLKRLNKSQRLLSDFSLIIKAASTGSIIHLVIPNDRKVWGYVNFETGEFGFHKKVHKKKPSVDLLNELAEEVIRQGGKIQILPPHFFPVEAQALAILKGSSR